MVRRGSTVRVRSEGFSGDSITPSTDMYMYEYSLLMAAPGYSLGSAAEA
jgi:hypothetical protein